MMCKNVGLTLQNCANGCGQAPDHRRGDKAQGIIYSATFLNKNSGNVIQRLIVTQPGVTPREIYTLPNGDFELTLRVLLVVGKKSESVVFRVDTATDIPDVSQSPKEFSLFQNYPNPFNPSTTIRFDLTQSNFVTLKVYNALGREVATLVTDLLPSGSHKINFDARDLPGGIYVYRLQAGLLIQTKKLVLLR